MENKRNISASIQKIADINMELTLFLEKFEKFQKLNIVDKHLLRNIELMYKKIDNFIEKDPETINGKDDRTEFNINLEQQFISRVFFCDKCNTDIGDRSRDVQRHINFHPSHKISLKNDNPAAKNTAAEPKKEKNKPKKEKRDKQTILAESRKLPKKAKVFLDTDIGKFLNDSVETANKMKHLPAYQKIKENLLTSIKPVYSNAKVHYFGSRISGLGSLESDLDIYLEIGDTYNEYGNVLKDKKVDEILKMLKKEQNWANFCSITAARVPILRAYHKIEKIDCDISFSNGLGHKNTHLMKYFFELQPICQKLCIFIKKWLKVVQLKTSFSTYTLVLMTVFYLQTLKILPSVKELQEEIKEPFLIGPWQVAFVEKSLSDLKIETVPTDNQNTLKYLSKLFDFYANNFNFKTLVVCPYLGKVVLKSSLNSDKIPEFPNYEKYYNLNKIENTIQLDKAICVQDPFELCHNIGKGVSDGLLALLKQYFKETSAIIKAFPKGA